MVEITGELIKSAISRKILTAIPSANGRVHKEDQNQNIAGDAFYIVQRGVNQVEQVKTIVKREYEMIVRYEPDVSSQTKLEKCAYMGNILMYELKSIDAGDGVLIHGSNMNFVTVDNAALVYVNYTIRAKTEPNDGVQMNELTINKEV